MSLWHRQSAREAAERPDPAALDSSTGGQGLGDAAPAAAGRRDVRRGTARPADSGDARQVSQSLMAAKQFDVYGQIG